MYHSLVWHLRSDSVLELRMRTRLPGLKLYARRVFSYWHSNCCAEARQDLRMLSQMVVRLLSHSSSWRARVVMRSVVESGFVRLGTRKVASVMSKGRRGSTLCAM